MAVAPRARILGHPVHQVLVVFPLGLLATSFFFDLAWLATGRAQLGLSAWWLIAAGVAGGAIAALFGLIDWVSIPKGTRARVIGAWHGAANLVVAMLFAGSLLLRRGVAEHPPMEAIFLSGCGVLLTVIAGWLGSELAERLTES